MVSSSLTPTEAEAEGRWGCSGLPPHQSGEKSLVIVKRALVLLLLFLLVVVVSRTVPAIFFPTCLFLLQVVEVLEI